MQKRQGLSVRTAPAQAKGKLIMNSTTATFLWTHTHVGDAWIEHPILQVTKHRVFIGAQDPHNPARQLSLTRLYLELRGSVYHRPTKTSYYTAAGKAAYDAELVGIQLADFALAEIDAELDPIVSRIAERARRRGDTKLAELAASLIRNQPFPLLDLVAPFSREDVLCAFRQHSKTLHPDHGGNPETFRALVAERDREAHYPWAKVWVQVRGGVWCFEAEQEARLYHPQTSHEL
jgi:hypothetical protein